MQSEDLHNKMYRKIFILFFCILLPIHLFAQSGICIGMSDTIYSSFRHPELFDAYVSLDPSFWWDDGVINRIAGKFVEFWEWQTPLKQY